MEVGEGEDQGEDGDGENPPPQTDMYHDDYEKVEDGDTMQQQGRDSQGQERAAGGSGDIGRKESKKRHHDTYKIL